MKRVALGFVLFFYIAFVSQSSAAVLVKITYDQDIKIGDPYEWKVIQYSNENNDLDLTFSLGNILSPRGNR